MGINKQLVEEERINIEHIDKFFNVNRTKNREVTRFAALELKINRYTERINTVVTDLNGIDMFLGYD